MRAGPGLRSALTDVARRATAVARLQAELEALRLLGITLGQGYLLGRPQPVEETPVNS